MKTVTLHQKIFRSLIGLSLLILITVSLATFSASKYLRTTDEVRHLEHYATILTSLLYAHEDDSACLKALDLDNIRISLIDSDGHILFDNKLNPQSLGDHSDREEVIEALAYGYGDDQRYSQSMQRQTFYYAVEVNDTNNILRLSFTSDSLFLYSARLFLGLSVLLALIIALSYWISKSMAKGMVEPFLHIDLNTKNSTGAPYRELEPFLKRIHTQQQQIESQVEEISHRSNELQVIIRSMSDGLVLFNAQGQIISINKVARHFFGLSRDESQNSSDLEKLKHSIPIQTLLHQRKKKLKQNLTLTKDGRYFEMRFNTICDGRVRLGYALVIIDETEKKQAEQLRQEFTANVSHELKTPLQSIIGYSELIANGIVKTDDIQPFALRILKQSTRLQNLIEDIIFLSSLDEGQTMLLEEVHLPQICREVFENLEEKAQERKVALSFSGDVTLLGVNRYFYELLYNLTDNALRYSKDDGHASFRIEMRTEGPLYFIECKDNGIGISPEDQFRIFERFYRVDKSHSRKTGGTGLGLSIVKRVVLYHQGTIKLKSALGKGSTFTLIFNKDRLLKLQEEHTHKQQESLVPLAQGTAQLAPSLASPENPDLTIKERKNKFRRRKFSIKPEPQALKLKTDKEHMGDGGLRRRSHSHQEKNEAKKKKTEHFSWKDQRR